MGFPGPSLPLSCLNDYYDESDFLNGNCPIKALLISSNKKNPDYASLSFLTSYKS